MATNKTETLNLHNWAKTDPFKMEDFNENFSALDANAGQTWGQLALRGNCCVETGSYTGNGETSRTLTFRHPPEAIILNGYATLYVNQGRVAYIGTGSSSIYDSITQLVSFSRTLNGSTLTFGHSGSAYLPLWNSNGKTYCYVAFTRADK